MKRKLFCLLTLLLTVCSGAWASTVDDLATISSDYTFTASTVNSETALSGGTLYDNNRILSVGGNGYTNGYQVKNNRQIAFKVSGACKVTITFNTKSGRYMQLGTTTTGTDYCHTLSSPAVCNVTAAGVLYINASSDLYVTGFTVEFPSADAPTITKDPVSATYEVGADATALSVTANASAGTLQYEWFSNTTESTEGAETVQAKSTTATYTPSTASPGTTYYYCKVYDDNGNTDSEFATISVVNAIAPEISYSDPAVTISCAGSGTVYYTTDGSEPSRTNGSVYSAPFNLTNSCTVRAVAKVGENYSELVKYDCYVDQSGAAGFLISTGYHSGTNSGSVWTSNDGNFTLTQQTSDIAWCNYLFPSMHGHKMNANVTYTLQPNEDIKITSIKIVGRTWLNGTAATVAVSNATPASDTWLPGEEGNVSYILAKEFTTSTDFGEAITITPSGQQFGCFLEVYGVKRTGPSEPETVPGNAVTWDFSTSAAKTAALNGGSFSAGADNEPHANTLYATDKTSTIVYMAGSSDDFTNSGDNYYIKSNSSTKNNTRYFILPISSNGTLSMTAISQYNTYAIHKAANASTAWASTTDTEKTITVSSETKTASVNITYDAEKPYLYIGFPSGKIYTQKIVWTPASDDITMTTSENMAGWRSFVDATQAYTIKEGETSTKAYIAKSVGENVVLSEYDGIIFKNMPVLLKTDRGDRTIVLTKNASNDSYSGGDNLLQVTTAGDPYTNILRLGYGTPDVDGAVGVGFYPYSTASAPAGVVYLDAPIDARALSIVFEDEGETTAISEVRGLKADERDEFYNLKGQRVAQPTKGLYIVNGRKVVIK